MGVVTAVSKADLANIATLTTTLAVLTSAAASLGRATHGPARPATTKKPTTKKPTSKKPSGEGRWFHLNISKMFLFLGNSCRCGVENKGGGSRRSRNRIAGGAEIDQVPQDIQSLV